MTPRPVSHPDILRAILSGQWCEYKVGEQTPPSVAGLSPTMPGEKK
ncbi:hypothetical protein LEMLEM_LOCUS985, partial [Lemmus lemmus]